MFNSQLVIKNNRIVLIIIILIGICIRLINLTQPLLEGSSSRQITTAMIARNYYTRGFRLFYPQVEGYGDYPGYLMQEFYIIPFIAAIFYKILGGVHELVLRLISTFFYIMATFMIYKLTSYYFNKKIGIISSFCFTVSPISIYLGRAVHPEMAIAFFNITTIYLFSRWLYDDKRYYGIFAIIAFVLSILIKIPNLYLLLPLLFIAFIKFGFRFFKKFRLWFFLIASLIPILMFNYHQYLVRNTFSNPAMDNFKIEMILKYIRIYLTEKIFYKKIFDDLITYTLTPVGFTLFLISVMFKFKDKRLYVFYFWMLAVIIFFLIMPAQSIQGYYQMHFLPIACIFIAHFIYYLKEMDIYKYMLFNKNLVIVIFMSSVLIIVTRYVYPYYNVPENFHYVVETGRLIDKLIERDALLIASIENGADLLYYSNRKGWPFMIHSEERRKEDISINEDVREKIYDPIIYLEYLRSQRAKYFASASMDEFLSHKEFSGYMFKNYPIIKQTQNYIIFDIKEKQ